MVDESFSEINVDEHLVEIIKTESKGLVGWYADVADDCDGLARNLKAARKDTSVPLHSNIVDFPLESGPSRVMTEFKRHDDLVLKLKTRDYQDEQMEILFDFVVSLEPERLHGYVCLNGGVDRAGMEREVAG